MVYCWVPYCKSDKKKNKHISFHEFPSNGDVRDEWLKIISRKDAVPSSRSYVCSLHFLESDYITGRKYRVLLPNAIPSVFPDYPQWWHQIHNKMCAANSVKKEEENDLETAKYSDVNDICFNIDYDDEFQYEGISVCGKGEDDVLYVDAAVQVDNYKERTSREIDLLKRRVEYAKSALKSKEDALKECKSGLEDMQKDIGYKKYCEIIKESKENNPAAIFLLDQINNFGAERLKWSETTIHYCEAWRNCSSKGYEYVRSNVLLKLPCRSTLKNYRGDICDTCFDDENIADQNEQSNEK